MWERERERSDGERDGRKGEMEEGRNGNYRERGEMEGGKVGRKLGKNGCKKGKRGEKKKRGENI